MAELELVVEVVAAFEGIVIDISMKVAKPISPSVAKRDAVSISVVASHQR